jgi:hypothetical protein
MANSTWLVTKFEVGNIVNANTSHTWIDNEILVEFVEWALVGVNDALENLCNYIWTKIMEAGKRSAQMPVARQVLLLVVREQSHCTRSTVSINLSWSA